MQIDSVLIFLQIVWKGRVRKKHKREKGEWKQSHIQDNDKVKCAFNGSVQSQRDKAQRADKVCAVEGNGRSGKALGIVPPSIHVVSSPAPPAGQINKQLMTTVSTPMMA